MIWKSRTGDSDIHFHLLLDIKYDDVIPPHWDVTQRQFAHLTLRQLKNNKR